MDRRDVGFISKTLVFLNTTRFGATRMAGSWNSAVKCAWVGVVPGWVTPGKFSPGRQKQSREPIGQSGQYWVEVGRVLQCLPIYTYTYMNAKNFILNKAYVYFRAHVPSFQHFTFALHTRLINIEPLKNKMFAHNASHTSI